MKAITSTAMLVTVGLLALSACVHDDDSERPATGEADATTESFDDFRGANSDEILDVTGAAAMSLPEFEGRGVVQSAGVGVASASGVSTSFDGTDLTITVSRDDGSALNLNTGSDPSEVSDPFESFIVGHSARFLMVLEISTEGMSAASAAVTANDDNATEYLAMGYWTHIAGDLTELSVTGVEIGAFVDSPELSPASPASPPARGTASYFGPASGAYSVVHGADGAGPVDSVEIGEFSSSIELTADFTAGTIEGCVGCREAVSLIGVLHDMDTGESRDVYTSDSGYWMQLGAISLRADGSFVDAEMSLENRVVSITSTEGAWGGRFSSIPDSDGDPRLVAGTFGAEATSAGGSEGAFLGSFVGAKQ